MASYRTKKVPKEREAFEKALMKYISHHKHPVPPVYIYRITRYLTMREKQLLFYATLKTNAKCNEITKEYYENIERQTLNYIKKNIGCKCEIQDDPRGMQIRLYLKEKSTDLFFNNFDGESSGVNWIHDAG